MLDQKQFDELVSKIGTKAAEDLNTKFKEVETKLNEKAAEVNKGFLKAADFEAFKTDELAKLNEKMAEISKLDEAVKEVGRKLEANLEVSRNAQGRKTIEDFILAQGDKIKSMREAGTGCIVITGKELKDAGITSIGGSLDPMAANPTQPYAPGIGGVALDIFEIQRNPNYILGQVDLGRTNQARMAWANETSLLGGAGLVDEGAIKPLIEHTFQVETSTAKKVAGYVKITEEFDEDLPGFGTTVRRMLRNDVIREMDNRIQAAVIAAARSYTLGGGGVTDANYMDALRFLWAQVVTKNFRPNSVGINPLTAAIMDTTKNLEGSYLVPRFMETMQSMITEANKVAVNHALVGDLSQYKVDIYKDFTLRIGWVNDDLIKNQFVVLGEIRYHNYISEARRDALVYDNLATVQGLIDNPAASS